MKTVYNCANHAETQNLRLDPSTRELIDHKYQQLRNHHPDLFRAELHMSAGRGQAEAHLLVHDSRHRSLEAHAKERWLHRSITRCFARADRQMAKTKRLT